MGLVDELTIENIEFYVNKHYKEQVAQNTPLALAMKQQAITKKQMRSFLAYDIVFNCVTVDEAAEGDGLIENVDSDMAIEKTYDVLSKLYDHPRVLVQSRFEKIAYRINPYLQGKGSN